VPSRERWRASEDLLAERGLDLSYGHRHVAREERERKGVWIFHATATTSRHVRGAAARSTLT
jgi:hypothetical protein